jgi:hypothetical protein
MAQDVGLREALILNEDATPSCIGNVAVSITGIKLSPQTQLVTDTTPPFESILIEELLPDM